MNSELLIVRELGQQDYQASWEAMRAFTNERSENSLDEVWLLEHPPIFTLGQNCKPEHILQKDSTPFVQTDRGGQVTYHGPGQLIMYTLIDIKRKKLNIRQYVSLLEQSVVELLVDQGIQAESRCKAPGVYVGDKKICSIGLRIRKGYAYHGLAFNISTDLQPFNAINPCGFQGLQMTSLALEGGSTDFSMICKQLINYFSKNLGYTHHQWLS